MAAKKKAGKAARKKTTGRSRAPGRKKSSRRKSGRARARSRARSAIDDGLADLEKQLPGNLKKLVRDFRKNLKDLQRQMDKARAEREARWEKRADRLRRDAAELLKRLEKGVRPPTRKKSAGKKAALKKARR